MSRRPLRNHSAGGTWQKALIRTPLWTVACWRCATPSSPLEWMGYARAGLGLMRRIDELHLEYPFAGSRMMRGLLRQEGLSSGRRHIATLMRRMGIDALYRKPNTSRRRPGHTVYPYLLRGLEVSRPNQVWAMDITYIPMARGFVYLAAVMDWHSRKVLAWRVSVTMDTDFCVEALGESLGRHGAPEMFNTDQGSQFTSDAFTGLLKANGIQISMDGEGKLEG